MLFTAADGPLPNHEQVGCCSRHLLGWVTPLVWRAWKGRLTPEMTPVLLPHLKSEAILSKVTQPHRSTRPASAPTSASY